MIEWAFVIDGVYDSPIQWQIGDFVKFEFERPEVVAGRVFGAICPEHKDLCVDVDELVPAGIGYPKLETGYVAIGSDDGLLAA